jgi:hypothetical protein
MDDAPAATAGAPAATDHEFSSHMEHPSHIAMPSRKSTWTKDQSEVHVSGTQTPHSMNLLSHIEPIHFDAYFVCGNSAPPPVKMS